MGRTGNIKGRTITTFQHSIRKLERSWRTLFKASQKAKSKGGVRSFYFHEKYKKFEDYSKMFTIKQPTRD